MDRVLIVILYILLALIMYIDINRKYIPNFLNFSIFGLAIFITGLENFESFFIGSACYSLPIILIYGYLSDLLKKEVFGFGDIKLIISLGPYISLTAIIMFNYLKYLEFPL